MAIKKFEDILVWQKSQDLAVDIYLKFKSSTDFGFRDQICRASLSISNNIVGGFDRSSNAYFKRFLFFAVSFNSEVRSILYLATRLDYLSKQEAHILIENSNEISKIPHRFIKSIR